MSGKYHPVIEPIDAPEGQTIPQKTTNKKDNGRIFLIFSEVEPESGGHADSLLKSAERVNNCNR